MVRFEAEAFDLEQPNMPLFFLLMPQAVEFRCFEIDYHSTRRRRIRTERRNDGCEGGSGS
jgi:hypothetical protein